MLENLPTESVYSSEPWAHFLRRADNQEYCVINNTWGLDSTEVTQAQHRILYDSATNEVRWNANIPGEMFDPARVRSYQQVYSGVKDQNLPGCGLDQFPCKVAELDRLISEIAFTVTTDTPRRSNAAAEIFLHSSAIPVIGGEGDTRAFELMVWMQAPDSTQINLDTLGTLTETTDTYGLYLREKDNYAAFILNHNVSTLSVDWMELLAVVVPYFPAIDFNSLWVTSIEFGTELYAGTVDLTLQRFAHHTSKVADTGSVPVKPTELDFVTLMDLSEMFSITNRTAHDGVKHVARTIMDARYAGLFTDDEVDKICTMAATGHLTDMGIIIDIRQRLTLELLRLKNERT